MTINLLDCTLRDGGYYNNWDFDIDLVNEYLIAMQQVRADFVELGLRQFNNNKYSGPYAYTSVEFLNRLHLPEGPVYGAMIDAKTVISKGGDHSKSIDELFKSKVDEKIGLVRVAAHFDEIASCRDMLDHLKIKGYTVGLNIMQASLRDSVALEEKARLVSAWNCVDVLYFADSLGSMTDIDVKRVYDAIRKGWNGDVGFHAHNNMGQGVSNVKAAIKLGCTWVDGTVSGMGRGAGNAETEYLLEDPKIGKYKDLSSIFSLVVNFFDPLKKIHGWGASIPYYFGAKLGLHPTYVQELCAMKGLNKTSLHQILSDLGEIATPQIFCPETLKSVISKKKNSAKVEGCKVDSRMEGREIVLVAQTRSSAKYREAILDYVVAKNAILVSINQPKIVSDLPYDYVVVSHNEKFREDQENYLDKKFSYIGPKKLFPNTDINIAYDYGCVVTPGNFESFGSYASIPHNLTLAYMISFCLAAKIGRVSLVGFSGYDTDSAKQKEMQEFLLLLGDVTLPIQSLTPTSFTIPERSIYAL